MNGVRRFLGGASTPPNSGTPVSPLVISGKPSWPPEQQSPTNELSYEASPKTTTAALFLRKQKPAPVSPTSEDDVRRPASNASSIVSPTRSNASISFRSSPMQKSNVNSPTAGPSSPRAPMTGSSLSRSQTEWKRSSGPLNTRDELLMSLLTSEAVVDSRDFEILSAEDIEELKKEQQVLSSRLGAMTKKLNLETKIRDAAISLSKVNASHKRISKQTDEQLDSANRRVETAQRELWRVSERANEVHRKLLEHRAGVLGFSVRNLEKQVAKGADDTDESGYSTPNRSSQMSPTPSSITSASTSSKARFDGAHLFAGHADALVPKMPKGQLSKADAAAIEAKLKTANQAMNATTQKQADLTRELNHLRLEKEQVETTLGMELQSAEETIISLEKEIPRLEALSTQVEDLQREKKAWERERNKLEGRLEVLEEQSGDVTQTQQLLDDAREKSRVELRQKNQELRELKAQWDADKAKWQQDKDALEDAKADDQSRFRAEMESIRSKDGAAAQRANKELEEGVNALRMLAAAHAIPVMSGNASLAGIIDSIGMHLTEIESQLQTPGGGQRDLSDASKVAQILQPVWAMLPSPEARAAKLSNKAAHTPNRSGSLGGSFSPTSPKGVPSSLSDMDVRSLKTLYDSRMNPSSPNTAVFSVEAFATRVQALVADDRSLIERLVRFAQAHDLLKKNAERAQKLATESNNALETYQKQVKSLEERNMSMSARQTAVQDELHTLRDAVDRIKAEKRDIEKQAAQSAQSIRELSEANDTLTARTLTLAEEAASAPEKVRQDLMVQLSQTKASLQEAQETLDAMRKSEQSQTEALLDELNSMQTENGNLRAQLRAVKK